jgi:hypothetical protein
LGEDTVRCADQVDLIEIELSRARVRHLCVHIVDWCFLFYLI